MSMTYSDWLSAMITLLEVSDSYGLPAFTALAPRFIEYAEGRLYRDPDLDFLATRAVDITQLTSNGSRAVPIPAALVVVEGVSLVTPANTKPSTNGAQRIPLRRTTRAFLDSTWPTETQTQAPSSLGVGYYALYSEQQTQPAKAEADEPVPLPSSILIAPTPDNAYVVEFSGTFRPAPLSAGNTSTLLTTYFPDLFLAASMISALGWQRDFGAQSEDPRAAMSWERLFQDLRQGAAIEELRKKALIDGFGTLPPSAATPAPMLAARAAQMAPPPQQGG